MRDAKKVTIQFPAALDPDGVEEAFATIQYDQYDPSELTLDVHLVGSSKLQNHSRLFRSNWNFFWLYGRSERLRTVEVLGITGASASGTDTIRPKASAVQIDISPSAETAARKYHFTAQLTPSGILVQPKGVEYHYTGEIKHEILQPGEVIVNADLGDVKAMEFYQTYERMEDHNRVRVVVQRAVLTGTVVLPAGESMSDVHEKVRSLLDDICDMLSLCYRTQVTYYELAYFELEPRVEPVVPSPLLRRKLKAATLEAGRDELINFRDLINGGLDTLYRAYRFHPHRAAIRRAIRFGVGSQNTVGLEQSYFLAYAALEAALGAASDEAMEFSIGASPFRRLCERLRDAVAQFALERGMPDLPDEINAKLPELRRRPTQRRIARLREKYDVKVDDLWPHLGFEAGFARATKGRNMLVHAAKLIEPQEVFGDQVRIAVLTERIILKLLGWPDEKVWVWHDQNVRWMNKNEGAELPPLSPSVA